MSGPKRHHYIPQMLLRRFVNDKGRLFFFSKPNAEKGVLESTPKDLFVEKHLYSAINEDGSKNVALENYYSQIEGEASQKIERIINAAIDGKQPGFSPDERKSWDHYVYHQWKRVPDLHTKVASWPNSDDAIEKMIAKLEKKRGPLTKDEKDSVASPEVRKRILKNAGVNALAAPGGEAEKALNSRGLAIAVVKNENQNLIVGSLSVIKLTRPGHKHLADPLVEVWMPISSRVAVGLKGAPETETLYELSDEQARSLNKAVADQSTMFAGSSRELIHELAKNFA